MSEQNVVFEDLSDGLLVRLTDRELENLCVNHFGSMEYWNSPEMIYEREHNLWAIGDRAFYNLQATFDLSRVLPNETKAKISDHIPECNISLFHNNLLEIATEEKFTLGNYLYYIDKRVKLKQEQVPETKSLFKALQRSENGYSEKMLTSPFVVESMRVVPKYATRKPELIFSLQSEHIDCFSEDLCLNEKLIKKKDERDIWFGTRSIFRETLEGITLNDLYLQFTIENEGVK